MGVDGMTGDDECGFSRSFWDEFRQCVEGERGVGY